MEATRHVQQQVMHGQQQVMHVQQLGMHVQQLVMPALRRAPFTSSSFALARLRSSDSWARFCSS